MSDLSSIVQVTIDRQTRAVARAGFGVPAIIAEFATSKTTTAFTRSRYYTSLSGLVADGWATTDSVYLAAAKLLAQPTKVERFMVGRIDSNDSTFSDALDAILLENTDWYAASFVGLTSATLTFSADLVASNSIAYSINGVAQTPIVYATSHANTMGLMEAAIEAAFPGSTATVNGRSITIVKAGLDFNSFEATVTLGASQATATATYELAESDLLNAAAWIETQMKIIGIADAQSNTYAAGGLGYQLKALGYDRSFTIYHATPGEYAQIAWLGKELPTDPGEDTWAFKTISGITADSITPNDENNLLGANVNIYYNKGSVSITRDGKVASGEYIDIIRGIDWIVARMQEAVYSLMVNSSKIPYNDAGIQLVAGAMTGVGKEAERLGILNTGSFVVTTPLFANISSADKIARTLPDMQFTGVLQGAIHKVVIEGTLTV